MITGIINMTSVNLRGGAALRRAGLMVENCTYGQPYDQYSESTGMVDTGRRRGWSEEEKARIVLESMSEPRLVAATARRLSRSLLVTWQSAFAATRKKEYDDHTVLQSTKTP